MTGRLSRSRSRAWSGPGRGDRVDQFRQCGRQPVEARARRAAGLGHVDIASDLDHQGADPAVGAVVRQRYVRSGEGAVDARTAEAGERLLGAGAEVGRGVEGVGPEADGRPGAVAVEFVRQPLGGVGVHVDDHGSPDSLQAPGHRLGHGGGVRVEVAFQERLFGRRVQVAQVAAPPEWLAVRGAGVDGSHADGPHLLPFVGEAFGVDDQSGQVVDELPGRHRAPGGGLRRDPLGVRVGDVVQLPFQRGVVEQDVLPNVRGDGP